MMSRRRAQRFCTLCGKRRKLTDDHIPPRCLFPKGSRQNLITVKACNRCNMRTSSDDEYLRLILASNKDSAACAQVQALLPTITRSLTRPEARRFANAFLSTIQNVDIVTRGGVYLYTAKGFSVDQPRLERIITKMVRGLFFKEFGRRLPSSHEVMPIFVNALRYRVPLQDVNQFQ